MARVAPGTGVEFPELKQIAEALKDFAPSARRKYMRTAFNAAAKVGVDRLKQIVPKGPTGNLKRSTVRKATANYGLAGFKRSGREVKANQGTKDGSHAGLLEFGTKRRRTKSRIASTFRAAGRNSSGMQVVVAKRGTSAGKLQTRNPKHPKSFFKGAAAGQTVDLKQMPVGGRLGKPPIQLAFNQAKQQISSVLKRELSTVVERASKDLARKFPPKGRS